MRERMSQKSISSALIFMAPTNRITIMFVVRLHTDLEMLSPIASVQLVRLIVSLTSTSFL